MACSSLLPTNLLNLSTDVLQGDIFPGVLQVVSTSCNKSANIKLHQVCCKLLVSCNKAGKINNLKQACGVSGCVLLYCCCKMHLKICFRFPHDVRISNFSFFISNMLELGSSQFAAPSRLLRYIDKYRYFFNIDISIFDFSKYRKYWVFSDFSINNCFLVANWLYDHHNDFYERK